MKSILVIALSFMLGLLSVSMVLAADGTSIITVLIGNLTGSDQANEQLPFDFSSQTLVDQLYTSGDVLDTDVRDGSTSIPYMPGTGRVQVLSCFDDAGADETVDCNDAGASDFTLPASGSEAFEFAFDNQARNLWVDIGTALEGTGQTLEVDYYNGTSYITGSGVTDGTDVFRNTGLARISWDFPAAGQWPESTLHAVTGYWMRVRVEGDAATVVPLGTRAWYETGRWWVYEDAIAPEEQKNYDVHLGIPATTPVTSSHSVAVSGDDIAVRGSDTIYPPAFADITTTGNAIEVARTLSGGNYTVRDLLLRFDTSAIPDNASAVSGFLTCQVNALPTNDDTRALVGEWYNWENASASLYQQVANNSALADIQLAAINAGPQTWPLQKLHNINRVGYTGMRLSISGGAPSGTNTLDILTLDNGTPCTLDLQYSDKTFHYYAPHDEGYTLPDNASLEPGGVFEISIAGVFALDGRADDFWVRKGTALEIGGFPASTGTLRININNGTNTETPSGITPGYHLIQATQGVTGDFVVDVDGLEVATGPRLSITDNVDDWEFFQNGGAPQVEYIQLQVTQVDQFTHQLRDIPGFELINHENPGTFNAIARYPDTISGFSSSVQAATAPVGGVDAVSAAEILGDVGAIDRFSDIPTPGPNSSFLQEIASIAEGNGGMPYEVSVTFMGIGLTIACMIIAGLIFQTALMGAVAAVIVLAILTQLGFLPGWIYFLFGIGPAFLFLIWKRVSV